MAAGDSDTLRDGDAAPAPSATASICPECGHRGDGPGVCPRDGHALTLVGDDALLGTTIDRFTITALLGVGGAGRVYRAVQPAIGARVAIKVLAGAAAEDREAVERFFAEARAVNLIRHEGLVKILDLSYLPGGRPYIVMEHLDGAPLSRVISRQGALPLGSLAAFAREVLDAVGAAHARGIVHRDLKPANLFVTPGGHARVLDFGLAKLAPELDARALTTRSGLLLGTPHYMAPEQADARPVDARTDLYAVGVILYEGATGTRPFAAPSLFELLRQQLEDTPEPPSRRRADLPAAWDKLIRRALEKDPAKRFQSAGEMAAALAAAAASLPASAHAPLEAHGALDAPRDPALASTMASPARGRTRPRMLVRRYRGPAIVGAALVGIAAAATLVVRRPERSAAGLVAGDAGDAAAAAAASAAGTAPDAAAAVVSAAAPEMPSDAAPAVVVTTGPADAAPRARAYRPDAAPVAMARVIKAADAGPAGAGGGSAGDMFLDPPARGPEPQYPPGPKNLTNFDVAAYIPEAQAAARAMFDDAELVMFYASMIDSGTGEIDLNKRGSVGYMFRSPARSNGDARCYVQVDVGRAKLEVTARLPTNPGDPCAWPVVPPPRCTPAEVWKKAITAGADATKPAYMRYILRRQGPIWEFTLMGADFDTKILDDC